MDHKEHFSQEQDKIEVLALQDLEDIIGGAAKALESIRSTLSVNCGGNNNSNTSNNCGNGGKAALNMI
jgi:hypothetical protein